MNVINLMMAISYQPDDGDKLIRELPFSSLIFARQWFVVGELLQHLPPEDRITPIVGMLQGVVEKGGELRVEVADTNESKELLKFCRKFTVPLRAALRDAGVLANYETPKRPVVHVFFIAPGCCYTGALCCSCYCTRLLLYWLLIQQQ